MTSGFDAIAFWLIDYYIAATVVLLVVAAAQRRISQPARRLALHWGALVGLVLLGFLCAVPAWPRIDVTKIVQAIPAAVFQPPHQVTPKISTLDVDAGELADSQRVPPGSSIAAPERQREPKSTPNASPRLASKGPKGLSRDAQHAPRPVRAVAPLAAEPEGFFRGLSGYLGPARLLALAIFAVGSLLTAARVLHGLLAARNIRRSASQAPRSVVAELEKLVGEARCPGLLVSHSHPVPIVTGTLRPNILLPPQFAERERPDDCRSVLAHELAHIQNGDLWLLALDRWLLPLFWLHPIYVRLRRSLRDDQELLADASAATHSSRTDYADMLVRWARRLMAEKQAQQLTTAVGAWDGPTRLAARISRLLHHNQRLELCCPRLWRVGSLLSLIMLPVLLSTATIRPDVRPSSSFGAGLIARTFAPAPRCSSCCRGPSAIAPSPEERVCYSMEQPAVAQIQRLGGSVKRQPIGGRSFVTEVNMVFHYTEDGYRVENTIFSEGALQHLAKLTHLRVLALADGQITNNGLQQLAASNELESLSLWDARYLSCPGVAQLAKLPRLRRLELTKAPIGDSSFARLAAVPNLEELSVEGSNLTEASLETAARMSHLRSLSLDLGARAIGREALSHLQALTNLRRLTLHCSEISDEALVEINALTNLRLLSLGDSRVSRHALAALRRSLPDLVVQTAQQTLRPRSCGCSKEARNDAPRAEEILSKVRQFSGLVKDSRSKAARLMADRPEDAHGKVLALRIYPSLVNVDWKLAFVDSNAALAVSSEFSNRCGATLAFTCRLSRIDDEWKIEDLRATSVGEGVDRMVVQFASAYPKARASDEWLVRQAAGT